MKKLIIFTAILLSCALTAIQGQNPILMYDYATTTTPLGRYLQSGNVILVRSTGAIYQLTKDFGSTATPASIVTDGHYRAYPMITTGIVTLTPLTTGTGSVGTSSLKFGTGYINALVNKDSLEPLTNGTGYIGTTTHHFGTGYINTLNATTGNITNVASTTVTTSGGSAYFAYGTTLLMDSVLYYPSRTSGSASWLPWMVRQAGTPRCRMNLQNMGDYSIQNKVGTGQVLVVQRDTSGTTAVINLPAVGTIAAAGTVTLSGALDANGAYNSTNYQEIDSTTNTAVTAGKQLVGVFNHYQTVLAADTINLSNMATGDIIRIVRLGATPEGGSGSASTAKTTIKAPAGHANLTAVFWPNAGSTTGAQSVDLTTAAPSKVFYKKDSSHIWVY